MGEGTFTTNVSLDMENTKKIINDNIDLFPEFGQYFNLIQVIEEKQNSEPNICIETCKALIEWVSKTIIRKHEWVNYIEKDINSLEMMPLIGKAIEQIKKAWIDIDDSFIKRICSLIQLIVEIRNTHWEISHGKHAPKSYESTPNFAKFILIITDWVVEYFLGMHYSIQYEKDLEYEDDELQEFNQFLDNKFPLKFINYSKALFDQDKVAYEEQFDEFKFSQ